MRIATWNVNSITSRLPRLLAWLESSGTDVLCVQELKCSAAAFPAEQLRELGYEAAVFGTGRWSGVAVLSRVGISDVVTGLPDAPEYEGSTEPRAVGAVCGGVKVWSVYVPNGREVGHPHFGYKLEWLTALREAVAEDAAAGRPFAVPGDFNVAPADEDVWDIAQFEGATHVTAEERAALAALRGTGLTDVLPRALKYDRPYSYWDYRMLGFPKNKGMRIDLVYANAAFATSVRDAYVDREERKGKGASDHAPVVVDLTL